MYGGRAPNGIGHLMILFCVSQLKRISREFMIDAFTSKIRWS